jgi:hypothetical protein
MMERTHGIMTRFLAIDLFLIVGTQDYGLIIRRRSAEGLIRMVSRKFPLYGDLHISVFWWSNLRSTPYTLEVLICLACVINCLSCDSRRSNDEDFARSARTQVINIVVAVGDPLSHAKSKQQSISIIKGMDHEIAQFTRLSDGTPVFVRISPNCWAKNADDPDALLAYAAIRGGKFVGLRRTSGLIIGGASDFANIPTEEFWCIDQPAATRTSLPAVR